MRLIRGCWKSATGSSWASKLASSWPTPKRLHSRASPRLVPARARVPHKLTVHCSPQTTCSSRRDRLDSNSALALQRLRTKRGWKLEGRRKAPRRHCVLGKRKSSRRLRERRDSTRSFDPMARISKESNSTLRSRQAEETQWGWPELLKKNCTEAQT